MRSERTHGTPPRVFHFPEFHRHLSSVGNIQRSGSRDPAVKDPVWGAEWTCPDGKIAGLVWTPHKAFEIVGRTASEDIRFFDCFGGELRVDVWEGKFALEISESPVYYIGVLADVKPKSLR